MRMLIFFHDLVVLIQGECLLFGANVADLMIFDVLQVVE